MPESRFAVFGAGFWTRFQLAAWNEIDGANCVAIYNRTRGKAELLADEFGIPRVYDDPVELLENEQLDFVDIITDASAHARHVQLAAAHRVPAICQKPLADTYSVAFDMVQCCKDAGVPLLVHENWRWQSPIRVLKQLLDSGEIGEIFRARVQFSCSFPVFENQPFLREVKRFMLADVGVHLLDAVRFLFGEANSLYCRTHRVNPGIAGEDVATLMLHMASEATVLCELSYASRWDGEKFPETFIFVEGSRGTLKLAKDYQLTCTTPDRSERVPCAPPHFSWADPAYEIVHASIVPCHRNLLHHMQGKVIAETTGEDNLRTLNLVEAAYRSAELGHLVTVGDA